jgi:hypothetical protein
VAKPTEAQRKRADARERRRTQSRPASDKRSDDSTDENGSAEEQPLDAVKQAAKVAAAGAAVGAAAAAARVLTSRGDDDEPEPEEETETAPQAEQEPQEPQGPDEPQEPEQLESSEENDDDQSSAVAERRVEEERPGATPEDARRTVQRAREQLEALLERPVESVSSFERTHDGWLVTLEVVEVSRIPESTDVLASYELELDDDRNLRRYARVRRYNRSQADLGDRS